MSIFRFSPCYAAFTVITFLIVWQGNKRKYNNNDVSCNGNTTIVKSILQKCHGVNINRFFIKILNKL